VDLGTVKPSSAPGADPGAELASAAPSGVREDGGEIFYAVRKILIVRINPWRSSQA